MDTKKDGKLRCDQSEMDWLLRNEKKITDQLDPLMIELATTRKKIKNLRARMKRGTSTLDEIALAKMHRESLKIEKKLLIPMKNELDAYIENRVPH
jgi:predicted  nucleic acid-binding Zn-ribbon protein